MITITLPDGQKREYASGVTGQEIAASIGAGLAKAALAIRVNDQLWDLTRPIEHDATIALITAKSPEGLELLRHDAAHVMAEAVKELYPETQVTIGPAIENGYYYDFYREKPFTLEDLAAIEQRMREIVDRDEPITREVWQRDEAVKFFLSQGEKFKAEIIQSIPSNEPLSVYRQGTFVDLCRGPHLTSTGRLGKAFKLMKLAGAYWRGDSKNPMLQRVYGTAWATQADLDAYLHQLEEAEKRDHRRLGREMGLFHLQEEAVGAVFWHPKGWSLYRTIREFIRKQITVEGYVEVNTPQLVDRKLWEASGHWEKFRENMFTTEIEENKSLALKPMNCPCHVQIFNQGIKSYRDLPLRMAEFGSCHRYELSGALHGIMRVRAFVQDDAHIFCTPDQITEETKKFCTLLQRVYTAFGFTDFKIKFSDRPAKRAGSDEIWDKAEGALRDAMAAIGLDYTLNPGEGAFYGPKLEFVLRDTIGRDWQCGTLQVDFVLPERLDAQYVGEDGGRHRPVMLHRAILGSFERFIGILIEHYAGKLPVWLAPVQVVIATITSEADTYAQEILAQLTKAGIRAEIDTRNEKITYKVREHSLAKAPYIWVAGKKEMAEKLISIRTLGSQDQRVVSLDEAIDELVKEGSMPS